ncbi:DUF6686 family protein [Sphingobacterium sp. JB170]|uniref:DUF6686 family protein n=1 Tax=Sphingobacterium sp. JB170 TaxID=1434842 RepID=UPI000B35D1AE|nr:DUF6686 family protein [Sphingobacterium sp. JB170]
MCKLKTLSREGKTTITQTTCCQIIHIWHSNLILRLDAQALSDFSRFLDEVLFETACVEFPDGEWKVIIHTPNPEISFAFDEWEFADFKTAVHDAL